MPLRTVSEGIGEIRAAVRAFFARRAGAQEAQDLEQELWVRVLSSKAPAQEAQFRSCVFTTAFRLLVDRARAEQTRKLRAEIEALAEGFSPLSPEAQERRRKQIVGLASQAFDLQQESRSSELEALRAELEALQAEIEASQQRKVETLSLYLKVLLGSP